MAASVVLNEQESEIGAMWCCVQAGSCVSKSFCFFQAERFGEPSFDGTKVRATLRPAGKEVSKRVKKDWSQTGRGGR